MITQRIIPSLLLAALMFFAVAGCNDNEPTNPGSSGELTVTIVYPAEGMDINGITDITALCTSSEAVDSVQFYIDGSLLGSDTNEPFTFLWQPAFWPDVTQCTITAKVYSANRQALSGPITVNLTTATHESPQPLGPMGDVELPGDVEFSWRSFVGAISYELVVEGYNGLPMFQQVVPETITTLTLPDMPIFSWRVRALDNVGRATVYSSIITIGSPPYPWPGSPEQALANFKRAYDEMNIDAYRDALHPNYKFIFAEGTPGMDPRGYWLRDEELQSATHMLSGEPYINSQGESAPGISDISFSVLDPLGIWETVPENDPDFAGMGAMKRLYHVHFVLSHNTGIYIVDTDQLFITIPIEEEDDTGIVRTRWYVYGQLDLATKKTALPVMPLVGVS